LDISPAAHQEDDVGVLVERSGHADPLPLAATQVDALKHRSTESEPRAVRHSGNRSEAFIVKGENGRSGHLVAPFCRD